MKLQKNSVMEIHVKFKDKIMTDRDILEKFFRDKPMCSCLYQNDDLSLWAYSNDDRGYRDTRLAKITNDALYLANMSLQGDAIEYRKHEMGTLTVEPKREASIRIGMSNQPDYLHI